MSENAKLRALLAEARPILWLHRPAGDADCDCRECSAITGVVARIDAALAEPVMACCDSRALLQDVAFACRGLRPLSDAASTVVGNVFRERDEARAEVERLRGLTPEFLPRPPDGDGLPRYGLRWNGPVEPIAVPMDDGYWTPWHLADAAFKRGAEAMREAAIAKTDDKLTVLLRNSLNEYRVRQAVTDAIRALPVPEDKP